MSQIFSTRESPKPFFTWAGHKAWLSPILNDLYQESGQSTYIEPFCGSLGSACGIKFSPQDVVYLNDANIHLINLYKVARSNSGLFIPPVEHLNHHSTWPRIVEETYYKQRAEWNLLDTDQKLAHPEVFFYLCTGMYRSLWRTNRKGKMNTPINRPLKRYHIGTHYLPENWYFSAIDWKSVQPRSGFWYFDPPYQNTVNSIPAEVKYGQNQVELSDIMSAFDRINTPVCLSEYYSPELATQLVDRGFHVYKIRRKQKMRHSDSEELFATRDLPVVQNWHGGCMSKI